MSQPHPSAAANYIRGGGSIDVDPRRLARLLSLLIAVGLAAAAVLMAVTTAHDNSAAADLRHRGVAVQATVVKCVGVSSGIGMGIEYYQCDGRFSVNGRTYDQVIKGNRAQLTPGLTVDALVIPSHPSTLTATAGVGSGSDSASRYVAPIVLGVLAVLIVGFMVGRSARRRARPAA